MAPAIKLGTTMKILPSLFPALLLTFLFPASAFCGVDFAVLSRDHLRGIAQVATELDCVEWMVLGGLATWVTLGVHNMRPRGSRWL